MKIRHELYENLFFSGELKLYLMNVRRCEILTCSNMR